MSYAEAKKDRKRNRRNSQINGLLMALSQVGGMMAQSRQGEANRKNQMDIAKLYASSRNQGAKPTGLEFEAMGMDDPEIQGEQARIQGLFNSPDPLAASTAADQMDDLRKRARITGVKNWRASRLAEQANPTGANDSDTTIPDPAAVAPPAGEQPAIRRSNTPPAAPNVGIEIQMPSDGANNQTGPASGGAGGQPLGDMPQQQQGGFLPNMDFQDMMPPPGTDVPRMQQGGPPSSPDGMMGAPGMDGPMPAPTMEQLMMQAQPQSQVGPGSPHAGAPSSVRNYAQEQIDQSIAGVGGWEPPPSGGMPPAPGVGSRQQAQYGNIRDAFQRMLDGKGSPMDEAMMNEFFGYSIMPGPPIPDQQSSPFVQQPSPLKNY
jgi:hypothetical protein|tara:strand:- start:17158 stop:18282 length:1125 start_codon:yes stop_codon:yes gene_type:complete